MSPENMIERVLAGGGDYDLLWDLIRAIRNGFPVENLRPMLTSDDERVTATAAYLAYEIGSEMRPVLNELIPLAEHPGAQWRSDIIIAMTECVGPDDLDALSRIMLAFDDPDPFLHRAAIRFVIMAGSRSLANAISEAAKRYPGTPFEDIYSLLRNGAGRYFSPDWSAIDEGKLREFIEHPAPVVRRFGAGLAARPKLVVDVELLEIARNCEDEEALRILDHIMWSPMPTEARLAKIRYLKSGSEQREPHPARQTNANTRR